MSFYVREAFSRWFIIDVLIPQVNAIRNLFDFPADIMAWVQLDGELI